MDQNDYTIEHTVTPSEEEVTITVQDTDFSDEKHDTETEENALDGYAVAIP